MLQQAESTSRPYWRWTAVAALVALIPLQLGARTPRPATRLVATQAPAQVVTAPSPSASQDAAPGSEPAAGVREPQPATALPEARPQFAPTRPDPLPMLRTPEQVTPEAVREIERSLEELRRRTDRTAAQQQIHNAQAELARMLERQGTTQRTLRDAVSSQGVREQMLALIESMGAQQGTIDTLQVIDRWLEFERSARSNANVGDSLSAHMDQLRTQQEILAGQFENMRSQQEELIAAQRHLAEQAEQLRQVIEARSR